MKIYVIINIANTHLENETIFEKSKALSGRYNKSFSKLINIKPAQTYGKDMSCHNLYHFE